MPKPLRRRFNLLYRLEFVGASLVLAQPVSDAAENLHAMGLPGDLSGVDPIAAAPLVPSNYEGLLEKVAESARLTHVGNHQQSG
jgi:hypothetical protein